MKGNIELVMVMERRKKDFSKRPDLLQEFTNRATEKLGIKLLDKPVEHPPEVMALVLKELARMQAEILEAG